MAEKCEAVVIGSGFGGAINACRLSRKWPGKVIVLERGKRYGLGEFPRIPHELARNFWVLSNDGARRPRHVRRAAKRHGSDLHGMFDVRNYQNMDVVICAGLGGGSLIYANVFLLPPDEIFDPRWPDSCKKQNLLPYYKVAKEVLCARPVPLGPDPGRKLLKTEVFQKVAGRLGRDSQLVDINVFFGRDPQQPPLDLGVQAHNRYGALQTSCTYCGECIVGCNYHAKNTLDLNYLYVAEHEHHADVRTECLVVDIAPINESGQPSAAADGSNGYVVEYVNVGNGARHNILTHRVILSAGSLGSTELLLCCRRRSLVGISERLGKSFSGNGDFLSFVLGGLPSDPNRGPTITQRIDYNLFSDFHREHAFLIEDASYPAFLAWFIEGVKPRWMWFSAVRRTLQSLWANVTSGKSVGRVGYALADLLSSDVSYRSAVLLCMGVDKSNGIMKVNEAGEFEITWPYGDSMELYKGILSAGKRFKEEKEAKHFIPLPTWTWPFRNNVTVHPLGGCVLADDEVGGVTNSRLDKFGEVFGYRGLYVADGAIVPSAVGSNPVATICALSEMVAEGITQISPDASLV